MSAPFEKSLRSLSVDDFMGIVVSIALTFAVGLLWMTWFTQARVVVYALGERARVEVRYAAHPIDTSAAGRIVALNLSLGRHVAAGEILLELDDENLRFDLAETKARRASIPAQLEAIDQQIAAKQAALINRQHGFDAARQEENARMRQADAAAQYSQNEVKRTKTLRNAGFASEQTLARDESEALSRRLEADAQDAAWKRRMSELAVDTANVAADLAALKRSSAGLQGDRNALMAAVQSLEHQIELRKLRAPVAGEIGEIGPLQVGRVVQQGTHVAVVVPEQALWVVADFAPANAVGRIKRQQTGRLRLDGFPWAQYGSIPLTVTGVGTDASEGRIRVELRIDGKSSPAIPLQHGLPGTVEVEVERISPFEMATRAAGRLVHGPTPGIQ